MTTGDLWQLFEFDLDLIQKRTHVYKAKTNKELLVSGDYLFGAPEGPPKERKIWNDAEMISLALGILKFGVGTINEGEDTLETIYEYLEDLPYMEKMNEKDKEVFMRRDRIGKYLPARLRSLYVGVDPREKNIYSDPDFESIDIK